MASSSPTIAIAVILNNWLILTLSLRIAIIHNYKNQESPASMTTPYLLIYESWQIIGMEPNWNSPMSTYLQYQKIYIKSSIEFSKNMDAFQTSKDSFYSTPLT